MTTISNKMRKASLLFAGAMLALHLSAQEQRALTGTIYEPDGKTPLIGAMIKVKGTSQGTVSDIDGKFHLNISDAPDAHLVVTYMGYELQEIEVGRQSVFRVVMKEATHMLKETVVTALGITREQKSLGYAVSKLSEDEVTSNLSGNWLNALDGKVAGLTMAGAGSGPIGSLRVTLRGDQSLNYGSNEALFVIDGIPVYSGTSESGSGSTYSNADAPVDFGNGASDINPDDIESVSVLKGPAATALYGSRAANGAIVITTKKGRTEKGIGVTFNSSVVWEKAGYWPEFQTEYGSGADMGLEPYCLWTLTADQAPDGVPVRQHISRYAFGEKYDASKLRYQYNGKNWETGELAKTPWVYQDDWYTGLFETGLTFDNSVSIEGSNGKGTSARLSITDRRNDWIMPNTGYDQQSFSLSVTSELNKYLTLNAKANYYNKSSDNIPVAGYGSSSVMYQLIWGYTNNSMSLWRDEYFQGRYTRENYENTSGSGGSSLVYPLATSFNPYRTLYEGLNGLDKNRFFGNLSLTAKLLPGLQLTLRGGVDYVDEFRTQQRPKYSERVDGFYREQSLRNYESNIDFLLRYTNNSWFDERLGFSVAFGGNQMYRKAYNNRITLDELDVEGVYNLANVPSSSRPDIYTYRSEKAINSLYGFASLSWDNIFFLDITGRNDWSSTLPRNNCSYFYPSVSGSVLLSEWFDFRDKAPVIDFLKVRLSWANVGNDTSPYSLDQYYSTTDYSGGYRLPSSIPDPNIKPENVESWETGLEMSMFKKRLTLDLALYKSSTTDQIVNATLDQIVGATSMKINAGEIQNKGIEVSLGVVPVRTKDFTWSMNFNWSRNWNKLVSLQDGWDPETPLQTSMGTTIGSRTFVYSYVGEEMHIIYGKGFKRAPEGSYYLDENGNKVDCSGMHLVDATTGYPMLDDNPTTRIGKVNPDWRGGMSQTFRYKNFTLTATFTAQMGGHAFSVTNFSLGYQGKLKNSLPGRYDGLVHEGVNAIQNEDGTITYKKNTTITQDIQDYYNKYIWVRDNTEANTFSTDFLKLKEVRLNYTVPKNWLQQKVKFVQNASLGVWATNLFCITSFPAYDPEVGMMNGTDIYKGIETVAFPMTRSYGVNLKLSF